MDMPRRLGAEFFGTFWLTFAGCGSAVLAAGFPALGIGFLGVSLAFGLTVLTMAYAVGHISGGHFNCAVTIGLWAGGRFKASDVIPYIIAQVAGAIVAAAVLYAIASGKPDWVAGGFASNGFGDLSPGKYGLMSCFFIEVIATFFFLYVIIGTTSKRAAVGFAGIPIGLCLWAAWPLVARAQAMPVIGFLGPESRALFADRLPALSHQDEIGDQSEYDQPDITQRFDDLSDGETCTHRQHA
jgi:aquaporin Z